MYVFPNGEVRGRVDAGKTITVRYWLRVTGSKPRFILMDSSAVQRLSLKIATNVDVSNKHWFGGFLVRSTRQRQLNITMAQKFWEKLPAIPAQEQLKRIEKRMARESNLTVIIGRTDGEYKFLSVLIN